MTRWDPLGSISLDASYDFSFAPRQFQWLRNGRLLAINNATDERVWLYEAPTRWEVGGLTHLESFNPPTTGAIPKRALRVHPSENTMVVGIDDGSSERYAEYAIPPDIKNSFNNTVHIQDLSIQKNDITGPIQWKPDGSEFYYIDMYDGVSPCDLRKAYNLDRPFRYSHNQNDLVYSGLSKRQDGFYIKNDGTKIHLVDNEGVLEVFSTDTAWDFTSMSSLGSRDLNNIQTITPQGFTWKPDGSHFYVSDNASNKLYQFDVPVDDRLYGVWQTSSDEIGVSYDEVFQANQKKITGYDHQNFSEISPDPESCWPLQESSGATVATDVAGSNDLDIDSSVDIERPAIYSNTGMRMGNNSNAGLSNTSPTNLNLDGFTFCTWFYYRQPSRDSFVAGHKNGQRVLEVMFKTDNNGLQMKVHIDGTDYEFENADDIPSIHSWYFIAASYSPGNQLIRVSLYNLQGSKVASHSISAPNDWQGSLDKIYIGTSESSSYGADSDFFEARWYNQYLTHNTQVQQLANPITNPNFSSGKSKHNRLASGPDHARTKGPNDASIITPDSFWPGYEKEGTTIYDIIGDNNAYAATDEGVDPVILEDGVRGGNSIYLPSDKAIDVNSPTAHRPTSQYSLNDAYSTDYFIMTMWTKWPREVETEIFFEAYGSNMTTEYNIHSETDSDGDKSIKSVVGNTELVLNNHTLQPDSWYFLVYHVYQNTSESDFILQIYDSTGSKLDESTADISDINEPLENFEIGRTTNRGIQVCNIRTYLEKIDKADFGKIAQQAAGPNRWTGTPVQL